MPGDTVAEVLAAARARYGERFDAVLAGSRVWVNGEPAADTDPVGPTDEVAVLPPVSGGATDEPPAVLAPRSRPQTGDLGARTGRGWA